MFRSSLRSSAQTSLARSVVILDSPAQRSSGIIVFVTQSKLGAKGPEMGEEFIESWQQTWTLDIKQISKGQVFQRLNKEPDMNSQSQSQPGTSSISWSKLVETSRKSVPEIRAGSPCRKSVLIFASQTNANSVPNMIWKTSLETVSPA